MTVEPSASRRGREMPGLTRTTPPVDNPHTKSDGPMDATCVTCSPIHAEEQAHRL